MAEVPTRGSNPLRGLAALAVLVLTGQTLAMVPQQHQTGIFVEDPGQSGAEALSRLESTMMQPDTQGTMGAAMTGGLGGVETAGMLEGERAARRVEPGVSFQFHFEEKSKRMPKMPTNLDEALENTWDTSSLPPTANAPKEFGLIKLEVKEGNRSASLGKAGGLMGGRGKPKGLVECVVEEIAPNTYRVKPKAPLAPGEYAFVYLDQGGGFVWDFGVGDR